MDYHGEATRCEAEASRLLEFTQKQVNAGYPAETSVIARAQGYATLALSYRMAEQTTELESAAHG